jgi:hypothetical protein
MTYFITNHSPVLCSSFGGINNHSLVFSRTFSDLPETCIYRPFGLNPASTHACDDHALSKPLVFKNLMVHQLGFIGHCNRFEPRCMPLANKFVSLQFMQNRYPSGEGNVAHGRRIAVTERQITFV